MYKIRKTHGSQYAKILAQRLIFFLFCNLLSFLNDVSDCKGRLVVTAKGKARIRGCREFTWMDKG